MSHTVTIHNPRSARSVAIQKALADWYESQSECHRARLALDRTPEAEALRKSQDAQPALYDAIRVAEAMPEDDDSGDDQERR
jgi:hypothetical protein